MPTGIVADLVSRRLALVAAGLVMGTGMLVVALLPGPGGVLAVLAGMAVWGAGWTFRSGAEDAWLADETDRATMVRGYTRGAQVGRVGRLLGLAVAVPLALTDLRLPLVAPGALAVLTGLLVAVLMPERGFTRPERTGSHLGQGLRTARAGARVVRATPVLVLVLGVLALLGAWEEGFDRLWEAHLLMAACALAFALAGSWWPAMVAYLATAVFRDLTGPPLRAWLNGSVTDSARRATVLSLTSVAGSAGRPVDVPDGRAPVDRSAQR